MPLKNTADRWGGVSQLLHWAIGVLILVIRFFMGFALDAPRSFGAFATLAVVTQLAVIASPLSRVPCLLPRSLSRHPSPSAASWAWRRDTSAVGSSSSRVEPAPRPSTWVIVGGSSARSACGPATASSMSGAVVIEGPA